MNPELFIKSPDMFRAGLLKIMVQRGETGQVDTKRYNKYYPKKFEPCCSLPAK
jgi:hypothetical protein